MGINSLFLFLLSTIPLSGVHHTLLICSPVEGHLDCFHFGAIINKAAKIFVNKSLCGHMILFPFCRMAQFYGGCL